MASPAYVTIATAGFPARLVEPVTSQLAADGTLRGQTGAVARRALEGLIYLCWMRSGIAGLLAGGVIAATNSSQGTRSIGLWIGGFLLFWLPAYMILLIPPWVRLRRSSSERLVREPMLVRFGPWIALGIAALGAVALARV